MFSQIESTHRYEKECRHKQVALPVILPKDPL